MNWLFFSLLSGLMYTVQGLMSRYILKGQRDAWAFSFFFSLVGALTALPFMLWRPQLSQSPVHWLILVIVGGLIVSQNYLNFKATNFLEASVQGSLTKFRLLWILLAGVIFLHESFSPFKLAGTLLTIAAGLVIFAKKVDHQSKYGIGLTLSATLIYAIVILLYKILFAGFNSHTLTFFIFAIPALINILIMPNSISRILAMAKTQGRVVLIATMFGGWANLAMNQALAIGEASKVLVIIEAFLVIVLAGEVMILQEKKGLWKKILAVTLATAGAILIRLSN